MAISETIIHSTVTTEERALATGAVIRQPIDAGLTDIAGLAVTDSNIIVGDGTNWVAESGATALTSLGVSVAAQTLLDDVSVAAIRTTLGELQLELAEGAFANGDKTKLDGIEALADVTDATNVTAAGALMDSEVTNLAQVKAFSSADYATAAQGSTADTAVQPAGLTTYQLKPTEGAFANGDKTKLNGIEALADVTDATNVAAAGAAILSSANTFTAKNNFQRIKIAIPAITPAETSPGISVGDGGLYDISERTGGFPQYGHHLVFYNVTGATVEAGEFDVGRTTWVETNRLGYSGSGTQIFGCWDGVNSPAANAGHTWNSGAVVAQELNAGNRWAELGLLDDVGTTRYTVGQQIVPDVLPSAIGQDFADVTISEATPAVISLTAHGFVEGQAFELEAGAGVLPATAPSSAATGNIYYVLSSGLGADSFQFSTSRGGAAINTTDGSGTVALLPAFHGSFAAVISKSIHGHRWQTGNFTALDSIAGGGRAMNVNGSATAGADEPATMLRLGGYFVDGIDFSGGAPSGQAIKFGASQNVGSASQGINNLYATTHYITANHFLTSDSASRVYFSIGTTPIYFSIEDNSSQIRLNNVSGGGVALSVSGSDLVYAISGGLGFFGETPVARPTSVAVTAAGVHAALVSLGLIT